VCVCASKQTDCRNNRDDGQNQQTDNKPFVL